MNPIRPATQAYKRWLEWLGGRLFRVDCTHDTAEVLGRDDSGRRFFRYQVQDDGWFIDQSGALWDGRRLVFAGYSPGYAIHKRLFGGKPKVSEILGNVMAPWPQQFFTYGDFLLQLLPEVAGILRFLDEGGENKVLIPHADREFVAAYLGRLGLNPCGVVGTKGVRFRLARGSNVFFKEKDSFDAFCASGDLLTECRRRVLGGKEVVSGRKIFVLREGTHRRALNFSSTEAAQLQNAGFMLLDPSKFDVDAQIELFAEAGLVAGIHGAGLANILWCKPGTCVVEIFHPRFQPNCYEILSGRLGLEYRAVVSEGKARGVYDINYRESNVEVDWAEFWRELGNCEALRL